MKFLKGIPVSWMLAALLAVAVLANALLTTRPLQGYSMYQIEEIATLPDTPELADVRRYTEIGSGMLPYECGWTPRATPARPPLKLGWTYRETSALRMPFWAAGEFGFVTYLEQPSGIEFGILSPSQVAMLEERLGRRFTENYSFPWYLHLWGWLPLIGLIVWTWLWRREANLAEEARWAA